MVGRNCLALPVTTLADSIAWNPVMIINLGEISFANLA